MDAAGAGLRPTEAFILAAQIAGFFNAMGLGLPSTQGCIDFIVPHLLSLLPPPFVPAPHGDGSSDDGAAAGDDDGDDGQDHIDRLPDDLLSNILSRLPTNKAAGTMVLSTRWRHLWAATPLLVDDAHLRPPSESAVSRCVAAHPGPVRAARITGVSFYQQEYALQRLVADLAAKNVQDLILFNRPWPLNMPLPDDILCCASLTRLYLGIWRWPFPDTAARTPAFPNLLELGLFHINIEDKEVDALLAHCPKLKILSFAMAYIRPLRPRVNSRSLRVVMEWRCTFLEVVVDDAPYLERLLFDSIGFDSIGERRPVKIVRAPRLEVLGFLDLQVHTLEIGGIVIRAGMDVRACAMVPSLKILAVKVRFWNDMEAKMLTTLLRCFPRLETLHIMSVQSRSPDIVDDTDFWKSLASCDCLESHLKTFVLHGFHSRKHEASFLHYIFTNGKVLKTHGSVFSGIDDVLVEEGPMSGSVGEGNESSGGSSGSDDVEEEEGPMSGSVGDGNESSGGSSGSDDVEMERGPISGTVGEGNAPSGGSSGRYMSFCPAIPCWSFQNAIDLSVEDPFYELRHDYAMRVHVVGGETPC